MYRAIDEESLRDLVTTFYDRVREDDLIGPVFNDAIANWPQHLDKLQSFWSSVMLTSGRYKGQPLPAHLKHGARIQPASFERWLSLWEQTVSDLFDEPLAARFGQKAERIAESLQLGIAFARGRGAIDENVAAA